ncbi:Alpha-(1,3)-fucosyltransferase 11 [Mortierella sp. AD011]|nr:Alpha-(1,3)-fucosyltransferase 11 [Mortierella sp. AD010]KAF9402396.1 Alpha-(1,3)-fucosyltransferase 11 [Mortierella sp. AD011]
MINLCLSMTISKRSLRQLVAVAVAGVIMAWLMFIQLYSKRIAEHAIENGTQMEADQPNPIHFSEQTDADFYTDPYQLEDVCNKLPEAPKHPRGILISHKTSAEPLKIFIWRQMTYMDPQTDWRKESLTLCPFPPELQPFFDFIRASHVYGDQAVNLAQWEQGFAPCFFFNKNVPEWQKNQVNTCGSSNLKYITTSNYTEFRDADIIYMDYPFYNYMIGKAPFWDVRRLPPRISHQRWVLEYGRESIANYPHVALSSFLQQFDLTMGAPAPLFDVPYPLLPVSEEMVRRYTEVKPGFPVDKKPDNYVAFVISNCQPRNDRNELIADLIKKIGAHSYGKCQNNRKMPDDETTKNRPWEEVKQEVLGQYPYTLVVENSNCVGYVTEKIYDALAAGVIPLYEGASDIADYVPKGSYVPLENFKNTDELVKFMKEADRSEFYKWKEEIKADPSKFCKSCHQGKEPLECRILNHVHFV